MRGGELRADFLRQRRVNERGDLHERTQITDIRLFRPHQLLQLPGRQHGRDGGNGVNGRAVQPVRTRQQLFCQLLAL